MRLQVVREKNEVIEFNDVECVVCEDGSGGRYTVYAKGHSLVVEQAGSGDQAPVMSEVRMVTEDERRKILDGIRNARKLLERLEDKI